jgi:hypothetical protein
VWYIEDSFFSVHYAGGMLQSIFLTAAAAIALRSKIHEMRTISKGRCRYEMVLIYQPPICACADFVNLTTQRNGGRGREKDLYQCEITGGF